jgi:hypothetical protein
MKQYLTAVVSARIVVAALAFAHTALAAPTFTVNNTADDLVDVSPGNGNCSTTLTPTPPYNCTLRAAFMEANHTSGLGATIVIPAGTYTLAMSAMPGDDETNGDLNLTTPASGNPIITITGAGADTTIIDANQIDRVLHIHAGRTVNITGVKIRNGYTANDGGGIWNEGLLTLTGCTIGGGDLEGNQAHSGGGIKNDVNAQLNADSSTFSNNMASITNSNQSGGGLFNRGAANLSKTTFSANYAHIFGGAIHSSAGAILYLDQSVVTSNSGPYGSGLSNAGTMHVTASTISDNVYYSGEQGGGIYNSGSLDVHDSAISGNGSKVVSVVDTGGGVLNSGSLVMDTSTISGNNAYDGGGIFNNAGATLELSTSTISGNGVQFTHSGGGISNHGSLQLGASTINDNTAGQGGGIDNSNELFVTDSTISGNTAAGGNGGGIANNFSSAVANVYNSTIVLNVAGTDSGGGVYNDTIGGARFGLHNTLVVNNYAPSVGQYDECAGTLTAYGRNLIGTGIGLPANCIVITPAGSAWIYLNPSNSLGALQNNGGPTSTHALLPGSNAIDGGDPGLPGCSDQSGPILTDQRGFPRTSGAVCDIGAFEYDNQIFKNGFE